jgi:tetratricopeptide (TPR) repeat protein
MHDIDKNNRETYQHEREFFEKRASGADQNQHALVSQQLSMGATVLSRTDNMLAQQIEGITKLGAVIELVRDSFDLQLKRETDLKQITKLLDDFNGHYRNAYRNMAERTLSLKVSRMGWTSLSLAQAELAAGARAEFRSIPESVLTESEKASPYEFAKVCQLVGTSSFYANDVGFADRLLRRARDGYRAQPFREDHRDPMAAASFFLGLVAKSWIEENRRLEDGLGDAKRCLEEAQDLLKSNKGEFLVPITLCEVLSYIQNDRRRAADALAGHIDVMSALETPDENQQKLLVRAHLLKGNLAKAEVAIASYREAQRLDPKNPYATLSIAMLTEDVDKREQGFRLGLSALRENKSLEKTEMTTRATAIVWAAVACHEVHDDKGLEVQLKTSDRLEAGTISTGGRVPLFFCPITKTLCRFDALRENLKAQLKPSAT